MKEILLRLCIFLISTTLISQNENTSKAFDSVFYQISVNISSSNPPKAMLLADSLYNYSVNGKQKLKALMLKADILEKQEKRGEAIQHALKALSIAEEENDFNFQARIYGFLSTQYRTIGFFDQGKSSLKKGLAISSKITNKEQIPKYRAMVDQELAEYALEEKGYNKAIEHLEMALLTYEREENEQFKNFFVANSKEMLGRAHMALGEKETALENFSEANLEINKADAGNTLWAAVIYQGLGNSFLENKLLDSAGVYLKKAMVISDQGKHTSLKESIYKSMAEYYKAENKTDSFYKYNEKYNEIFEENKNKKKQIINSAYNTLNKNPEQTVYNTKYLLIGIFSLLVVFLIFYFNKKGLFSIVKNGKDTPEEKANQLVLPTKTEEDLLKKLNEFEASNEYLDKNMSFSVLVAQLGTNAKYLSYLIKHNKNKDYNTYINELRINYIVKKLKTDPDYLNYKISYLAEECGFSSHSKFSANFKRVMNLSPSEFIDSLRD